MQNTIRQHRDLCPLKRQGKSKESIKHDPKGWVPTESTHLFSHGHRYIIQCSKQQRMTVNSMHYTMKSRNLKVWLLKLLISKKPVPECSDLAPQRQWHLLKITLQAPFLNVQKTFDRSRSSLGLYGNDV
ncbi:hypothetical protein Tco_1428831 [Tanacetum coccineum]